MSEQDAHPDPDWLASDDLGAENERLRAELREMVNGNRDAAEVSNQRWTEAADELEARRRAIKTLAAERDAARADLAALRAGIEAKAREWDALPCVHGYRIPNGNDDESQCLNCEAIDLRALLGGQP